MSPLEGDLPGARNPPETLSQHQWDTLLAIANAFVGVDESSSKGLEQNPSSCSAFLDLLSRTFGQSLPSSAVKEVRVFLTICSGYAGYLLNGTSAYLYDLPRRQVEQIIQGWIGSRLKPIRTGAKGLGFIIRSLWIMSCPGILEDMGHPGHAAVTDDPSGRDVLEDARTVDFEGELAREISTGLLVVGSGSGGSAFTHSFMRNLPQDCAGEDIPVLVVDKGSKAGAQGELSAFETMYEGGGILASDESAISVVAGSTWGGGSRINWSACLQTDRMVREEWTRRIVQDKDPHGRIFLGREWQECMEQVEEALGVQTPSEHNAANRCLIDGARKLGYSVKAVPQNISDLEEHVKCGADCTIGCRSRKGKRSGAFLHSGVAGLDGFDVERILFDDRKAVGAVGWVRGMRVVVRAKVVVLSGGTLNSPAVLLRSGVKNPHIGQNLHLHPTLIVHSTWPREIRPWEGTILTSVINEFSNIDGKGHGVKLEAMCMLPSLGMAYTPWQGSGAWRERMRGYPRTMGHILICREEATGRVYLDAEGKRRISYVTGAKERAWINEGFEGLAKLLYVQGAEEIYTSAAGLPIWRRESDKRDWADDQSFNDFLAAYRSSGFDVDRFNFGSAHQMGTCRMSGSPGTGVVDPRGKVWGYEGLYIADASVFPSASGVNPMITTMAFGEWIGRRVAEEVQRAI